MAVPYETKRHLMHIIKHNANKGNWKNNPGKSSIETANSLSL